MTPAQIRAMQRYREKHKEELRQYHREYAEKNRAKFRVYSATWRKNNPEKAYLAVRTIVDRSKYGLEQKDYAALALSQDYRCAICRSLPSGKRRLHVDHDHTTGSVRGLLCHQCNIMIGMSKENIQTLLSAIRYLILN